MKAVLISIQPKWCELIASGKKTVEVRKTKPKIQTPFKVYIYCTQGKEKLWVLKENERPFTGKIASVIEAKDVGGASKANGKVIGEFVCRNIDFHSIGDLIVKEDAEHTLIGTCLGQVDVLRYIGYPSGTDIYAKPYMFYAWHISDLVIYDKPKELREFRSYNVSTYIDEELGLPMPTHEIKRPPQSYMYVEELR